MRITPVLAVVVGMLLTGTALGAPPGSKPVVATDVQCSDCVGATDIASDSVGSSEIQADSVGGSELQPNAVGAAEITDGSVGEAELAPSVNDSLAELSSLQAQVDALSAQLAALEARPSGTFSVFDSLDNKIGPVFIYPGCPGNIGEGGDGAVTAIVNLAGEEQLVCFIRDPANGDRIQTFDRAGSELYFESSDCTGTGYVPESLLLRLAVGFRPIAVTFGPNATLYSPIQGATPRPVSANSMLQGGVCKPTTGTNNLVPISRVMDLEEQYQPPFDIR